MHVTIDRHRPRVGRIEQVQVEVLLLLPGR